MKFITLGRYSTEFLTLLVRDNGIMDLEQAHWRLSAYPALAAGFRDRGFLREGAPADIIVYEGASHGDYAVEADSPEHQQTYAELNAFLLQHLQ